MDFLRPVFKKNSHAVLSRSLFPNEALSEERSVKTGLKVFRKMVMVLNLYKSGAEHATDFGKGKLVGCVAPYLPTLKC